jgi:uncharacterized integral membrane protein (TIGR00698 family)
MLTPITRALPGLLLCAGVTVIALILQTVEQKLAGQAYLEALVLAILLGVAIRAAWHPGPLWTPGIGFSAKILLEVAVVLLGAAVSVRTVLALGPKLLAGIAATVAVSLLISYAICRALRLPRRIAILIACGNSICGNSAIAAIAPVIGADADEITTSIAFTAVLGVIVVLLLPLLVPLLSLSLTQYGVLAGLTVYAVPQVLAATLPIGALSNQVGTVVKLVRVLMLGPVVLAISLFSPHKTHGTKSRLPDLSHLIPWFIAGFLAVLAARSAGMIPANLLLPLKQTAATLTTISMAALGLGVDIKTVAKAGPRVTTAVTLSLVALGAVSLLLIRGVGIK